MLGFSAISESPISALGVLGATATLAVTFDGVTLLSTGEQANNGVLSIALDGASLLSVAVAPETATLSVTLGDTTLVAAAIAPAVATLSVTLDEMSAVIVGRKQVVASLSVSMDGCYLDAVADRSYSLEQIGVCDIPTPGWFYGVRARTGAEYSYRK